MLSNGGLILLRHYIQEGLSKSAIARKLGISRRTVHRYLKSGQHEASYGPRPKRRSKLDPFETYLRGRLEDYSELSGVRLLARSGLWDTKVVTPCSRTFCAPSGPSLPCP